MDGKASRSRPVEAVFAPRWSEGGKTCTRSRRRLRCANSPKEALFKEGDTDKRTYFLVQGTIEIYDNDGVLPRCAWHARGT